ncbi:MAG: YbhB/YbcL family Raf kinase inhibitor-like protein [Halobellus sp.]
MLCAGAAAVGVALAGCSGADTPADGSDDDAATDAGPAAGTERTGTTTDSASGPTPETPMPSTILNGDVEQRGSLSLASPDFAAGGRLPDSAGYGNANENPALEVEDVPSDTESLVLVVDDPDARPVAGHTWTHWLVWDVPPGIGTIPRGWSPSDATEGFNDFLAFGYGGPAPPEGSHRYRFKLLALDSTLGAPRPTRKTRLGSLVASRAEVLGATQLAGTYAADQG